MSKKTTLRRNPKAGAELAGYDAVLAGIVELLETARRTSARAVNAMMTATYWEIGRRIVECEQGGKVRADYGQTLIARLACDLTARFGRGFSERNVWQMKAFYLVWGIPQTVSAESGRQAVREILQTPSAESSPAAEGAAPSAKLPTPSAKLRPSPAGRIVQTLSEKSFLEILQTPSARCESRLRFPLSWSHYVKLLSVQDNDARAFYEAEALRGGWSVRQLDRQIDSLFYERTLMSRNKAAMLRKGSVAQPGDAVTPEEEIKDPLVLEFLGLKDEYSESELEAALIQHLEAFLLELGGDFTFVGRQRRLRIGDEWYRLDLLFFHRRLRCLVVIDLKLGKFTHADAGQMHLYLNYVREHWMLPDENPPVGVILCAQKDDAVVHYALENLPNKVLATEYRLALPDEKVLIAELKRTQKMLQLRHQSAADRQP